MVREEFDPMVDISGIGSKVIKAEFGASEGARQFRNKFFGRIGLVAKPLPELTIEAGFCSP